MKRGSLCTLTLLLLCGLGCGGGAATETTESSDPSTADTESSDAEAKEPRKNGVVVNRPEAAPGYVLFSPLLSDVTYLVDRDGLVVHTWQHELAPSSLYLQDDGTLIRTGRDPEAVDFKAGGVTGYIQRFDWDGNLLWQWKSSDAGGVLHHDIEIMPNGNILALGWEVKTRAEAERAGRRPELIGDKGLWPEYIVEIEPLPDDRAKVVWKWHAWDHMVQDHDPDAPNYGVIAEHPRKIDINQGAQPDSVDPEEFEELKALGYIPEDAEMDDIDADMHHANAIAYHPQLDQIVISVPEFGEIWILDHSISTEEAEGPAGDLLYRWGNPQMYGRGEEANQRLHGQHDVRWIEPGLPGAGNLLVLNNGGGRSDGDWTSVDELAVSPAADGTYPLADGEAWGPEELAWTYSAGEAFFAPFISGAHRLDNGNTLVTSGPQGRFLEVTPAGEIVWEYWHPYLGTVTNRDGSPAQPVDEFTYAVFRATHIPPDHPALAGRTLEPLDPQPEHGQGIPEPLPEGN